MRGFTILQVGLLVLVTVQAAPTPTSKELCSETISEFPEAFSGIAGSPNLIPKPSTAICTSGDATVCQKAPQIESKYQDTCADIGIPGADASPCYVTDDYEKLVSDLRNAGFKCIEA